MNIYDALKKLQITPPYYLPKDDLYVQIKQTVNLFYTADCK